jgi:hypothetical protein
MPWADAAVMAPASAAAAVSASKEVVHFVRIEILPRLNQLIATRTRDGTQGSVFGGDLTKKFLER